MGHSFLWASPLIIYAAHSWDGRSVAIWAVGSVCRWRLCPPAATKSPSQIAEAMLLRVGLARSARLRGGGGGVSFSLPLARRLSFEPPPPDTEWTDTVEYLDESGALLSSARGARPAVPGADPTILSGASAHPLPRPAAAARLAVLALRHRSGAPLSAALSALPSAPDAALLLLAASSLPASDPVPLISLVAWARLQPWFVPSDDLSSLLAARLPPATHSSELLALFDETLGLPDLAAFPKTFNAVVSALATHGLLEPAFYCFKRLRDASFRGLETPSYNALLSLLLTRGLAFKAFEVLDQMATSGCALDEGTYDLAVPALR